MQKTNPASDRMNRRRKIVGTVLSNKMQKTIVVQTTTRVLHPQYGKVTTQRNKFKAHDEENKAQIGDVVLLQESRPLSRDKRWLMVKIIQSAPTAGKPVSAAEVK